MFKLMAYFDTMQTPLYTEDWIGLKTLDEAGKVKFINVSGGHLDISRSDMKKHVVPYLKDGASTQMTTAESSSSLWWLSSMWNFFMKLGGLKEDQHLLSIVY